MDEREIPKHQSYLINELESLRRRLAAESFPKEYLHHPEMERLVDEIHECMVRSDEPLHPKFIAILEEVFPSDIKPSVLSPRNRRQMDEIYGAIKKRKTGSDSVSIDIGPESSVVFLLGAGASVDSGIPTVNGLLDELLVQAQRTQMEDLEPLISYCQGRDDIDIEDVLTAAYLSDFAVSESHVVRLLHYFLFSDTDDISETPPNADVTSVNFIQNTLQTLFGLLSSTMIPKDPNPTHEAIQEFVESHENASIITTNYDYCMDEQLLENDINLDYFIEGSGLPQAVENGPVDLVKMHGSINWWYCGSCQSVGKVDPQTAKQSSEEDAMDYPVIGVCPHCGGQRRPLLVPPISFKFVMFPPLIRIWDRGKQIIEEADYIIAVGYSFSDSDAYIYKLISKSLTDESDTELAIVNPNRSVVNRLRDRFAAELGDFEPDQQIQGVPHKSEEIMPDLVEDMLDYQEAATDEAEVSKETEGDQEAATDD